MHITVSTIRAYKVLRVAIMTDFLLNWYPFYFPQPITRAVPVSLSVQLYPCLLCLHQTFEILSQSERQYPYLKPQDNNLDLPKVEEIADDKLNVGKITWI